MPLGSCCAGTGAPCSGATRGGRQLAVTTSAPRTTTHLADADANNAVSLNDAVEHGLTRRHLAEDGVAAVEMRLRRMGDEELAAAGVRTGQRHPERPPQIAPAVQLVANGVAGPAVAVAARVAALHH